MLLWMLATGANRYSMCMMLLLLMLAMGANR